MASAKFEITDNEITIMYEQQWYCFPFIILEDIKPFMDKVFEYFGFDDSGYPHDVTEPKRNEFLKLVDRGNIALIRDWCKGTSPFVTLANMIQADPDKFPMETCKLY